MFLILPCFTFSLHLVYRFFVCHYLFLTFFVFAVFWFCPFFFCQYWFLSFLALPFSVLPLFYLPFKWGVVQCNIEESSTQSIAFQLVSTLFYLSDSIRSSDRITPNPIRSDRNYRISDRITVHPIRSDRGYRMKKLDPIQSESHSIWSDMIRSVATLTRYWSLKVRKQWNDSHWKMDANMIF